VIFSRGRGRRGRVRKEAGKKEGEAAEADQLALEVKGE
jgi:hypothetical protein